MTEQSVRFDPHIEARRRVMALCARAHGSELRAALASLAPIPSARDLRAPQTGLTMLRGRAGGDGEAFNLGEATMTRAAVVLDGESGHDGFAYHLGRDGAKARDAAILDALWQSAERRSAVEAVLEPVRLRLADEQAAAARQAAATRVNFFTLVRGEN